MKLWLTKLEVQQGPGTISTARSMAGSKPTLKNIPWGPSGSPSIFSKSFVQTPSDLAPGPTSKEKTSSMELSKPRAARYCFQTELKVQFYWCRSMEVGFTSIHWLSRFDCPSSRLRELCPLRRFEHTWPFRLPEFEEDQRWAVLDSSGVDRWLLERDN